MNGILLAITFAFMVIAIVAAIIRRWFPRASVTVGLAAFAAMGIGFIALLALDAVEGQMRRLGRGNGTVLLDEHPAAFWWLLGLYAVAGMAVAAGSIRGLRKHLRGEVRSAD